MWKKSKWFVIACIFAISSIFMFKASAMALDLFSITVTGSAVIRQSDEARVVNFNILSSTSVRVRLVPTSATIALNSYAVDVMLDDGTILGTATVSWTAIQITNGTPKSVDVSGLSGLTSAIDVFVKTRRI